MTWIYSGERPKLLNTRTLFNSPRQHPLNAGGNIICERAGRQAENNLTGMTLSKANVGDSSSINCHPHMQNLI